MKKKPAPRRPVKGTWRPPSLRNLWETIHRIDEVLREQMKKTNDHSNEIFALQHPTAPGSETLRVVNNQAAEVVAPKESSLDIVRKRVCHLNGHRIVKIERQIPNTELPDPSKAFHRTTVLKEEILCLACTMTLEEIRTAK